MVQTYGVAENRTDTHEHVQEEPQGGESSALLGGDATPKQSRGKRDGAGSLVSSVSNLANTIIGSGTFPF